MLGTIKLVKWVQQVLDPTLDPDDTERIIVEAKINGHVFLEGAAGNRTFFRDAGLSLGPVSNSIIWPKA